MCDGDDEPGLQNARTTVPVIFIFSPGILAGVSAADRPTSGQFGGVGSRARTQDSGLLAPVLLARRNTLLERRCQVPGFAEGPLAIGSKLLFVYQAAHTHTSRDLHKDVLMMCSDYGAMDWRLETGV